MPWSGGFGKSRKDRRRMQRLMRSVVCRGIWFKPCFNYVVLSLSLFYHCCMLYLPLSCCLLSSYILFPCPLLWKCVYSRGLSRVPFVVAFAQIDWNDFTVVQTIDFSPSDTGLFCIARSLVSSSKVETFSSYLSSISSAPSFAHVSA